jgi:hypothetical protein
MLLALVRRWGSLEVATMDATRPETIRRAGYKWMLGPDFALSEEFRPAAPLLAGPAVEKPAPPEATAATTRALPIVRAGDEPFKAFSTAA